MTERPRVSVVVPACNEGEGVISVFDRLFESVRLPSEVLVVVDSADDTTVPVAEEYAQKEPRLRCLVNTYGRGPANAIRFGIDAATAPVVVVTMADGCDDVRQIDELVRLVERGVAVAAASRYMPGGQQVGGPMLKGTLSRLAGRSLRTFAHVGTSDATNIEQSGLGEQGQRREHERRAQELNRRVRPQVDRGRRAFLPNRRA